MNRALTNTALAIAVSVSSSAYAQNLSTTTLDPILVTPNRFLLSADETLASTSLITKQDIARQKPRDTLQALNKLPGVQVVRNGAIGQSANLYLRGTEADHTLILIDGMRVSAATNGAAALQHVPVDQIQRIEVVRGPRASLYGADAIGGVIQVFTRESAPHASFGLGSRGSHRGSVGFGVDQEDWMLTGSAASVRADGYDTYDNDQPDEDGYKEDSVALRGKWQPADGTSLGLSVLRSYGEVEFDDGVVDGVDGVTDFVNQSVSASAQYDVSKTSDLSFKVGQAVDERETKSSNPAFDKTTRNHFSAKFLSRAVVGVSVIGVDYYNDQVDVETSIAETQRYNIGVFAQHQIVVGNWDSQLSLRYDDNEAYGAETTGSAAIGRSISENSRFFVSHGTAFKAPTFNDLYDPDLNLFGVTYSSNPDLNPETSRSTEAGLTWHQEGAEAAISAFYTDIDNLIANEVNNGVSRPENINEARIRGVELTGSFDFGGVRLSGVATLQDPEDLSDGSTLPKRAERTVTISAETTLNQWMVAMDLRYVGETGGGAFSAVPSYNVVGVSAERSLGEGWSGRVDIENAFDREYETTPDYPAPGRSVFLSIEWRPGR